MRDQWEFSALGRLLKEGADEDVQRFFLLLRPPEIADLLENTPEDERARVVRLMGAPLASEVLREVEEDEREDIMEDLSSAEIAEIVPHLRSDDAADLLGELPPEKAERTLDKLEAEDRQELRELLEYKEDTAGGIMQTELVTVPHDATVQDAIDAVRKADAEEVGEVREVFLVDADGRLIGGASPSDLLHADPAEPARAVADVDPVKVAVDLDQEKIAELVREHDLVAIPVVDAEGVLVGQVLHDDVADVLEEEATEDIAKMAGADPGEVYEERVMLAVRSRALWLLPAFGGGLAVAAYLGGAETTIRRAPLLLAFLPVILGMAGNVGTQTSALTVRGLALGRIRFRRSILRVIRYQILTGLSLGVLFGGLLAGFAALQAKGDVSLTRDLGLYATALGVSILTAMTVGACMGVSIPIFLHRLGFDPAIATSPFVQTANDLTGALILMNIAGWLGLLG